MNIWEKNIKEVTAEASLFGFIVKAYKSGDFLNEASAPDQLFITRDANIRAVYNAFHEEIHHRASIGEILEDDATNLDYGEDFYAGLMSRQVNRAIGKALQDFHNEYHEVIELHQNKKLSELIALFPDQFKKDTVKKLENYNSLREFMRGTFRGRDLIGSLGVEDAIDVSIEESEIFELFPDEIRELADREGLTASDLDTMSGIVIEAIHILMERLYRENKTAILKNPEKKLNELGKKRASGRGER